MFVIARVNADVEFEFMVDIGEDSPVWGKFEDAFTISDQLLANDLAMSEGLRETDGHQYHPLRQDTARADLLAMYY